MRYDLEVHVEEQADELQVSWIYNRALFDRWRIEQMAAHYQRLLQEITRDASQAVSNICILSDDERDRFARWNSTHVPYADDKSIADLFELQVEGAREAVALTYEVNNLTFGELNAAANRLAHHLIEMGVGSEARVGICLERSFEAIIAILAVVKAGVHAPPIWHIHRANTTHCRRCRRDRSDYRRAIA